MIHNVYLPFGWRLRAYRPNSYSLWRIRGYTEDEKFAFKFLGLIWSLQEIPWWRR